MRINENARVISARTEKEEKRTEKGIRPTQGRSLRENTRMKRSIYTDGACSGNPARAAGALSSCMGTDQIRRSNKTTNNRMELLSVIAAWRRSGSRAGRPLPDSYVVNAVNEAGLQVEEKGWRRRDGDVKMLTSGCADPAS